MPTDKIIISCEGLRADESEDRAKKNILSIRPRVTSSYYDGMTVEEAIANFKPGKRLVLNFYPILARTAAEVYELCGQSLQSLMKARKEYRKTGKVPAWWNMHPAYVYGNNRVSCRFCILGEINDLQTAKRESTDDLLEIMIGMEKEGDCTFKNKFSLTQLT